MPSPSPVSRTFASLGPRYLLSQEGLRMTFNLAACMCGLLLAMPQVVRAQDSLHASMRAVNLARNTAIVLNGGMGKYVPDKCMFDTSQGLGVCLIGIDQGGYLYRFVGGRPGWQTYGEAPTIETMLKIAPNGTSVSDIIYNGPVRLQQR